jgi:hypothetical protein
MAKNDKVLIDGIIDERITLKTPSDDRSEAFEYFSFEQILKDYDLSADELKFGSVDGRNDGGIDGIFIIINGHLLTDPESFNWPKSGAVLEIWIITCKHHDTFKQAPLDNLVASISELFDFSTESENLVGDYSEDVKKQRENLKFAYRKVSPRLNQFNIYFTYSSRGDTSNIGESIVSRSKQIVQFAKDSFNNCSSEFFFYGSSELIELYRKVPNFTLEIPFVEDLSSGTTYILLVRLKDYYAFIQDEGKLRRYLFDSNVRDFMGLNRVNEDIKSTLFNNNSPDFWWLNNGVTILATGASVIGKSIQIQDIQIVNGLQTSESIFRYFSSGEQDHQGRCLLVKVIISRDSEVRDAIIRATNNQTTVELSSLHATDRIQRDIEDILKQNDLYYERRTNFYKNQGITPDKLLTPLYLASGYVNLILKSPSEATRLKNRFMRSQSSYSKIFSESTDLKIWPKIASILKTTDIFLESVRPTGQGISEHFLKSRRQVLSFITTSRIFGTFNFSTSDVINLDMELYNRSILNETWELISSLETTQRISRRIKQSQLFNILSESTNEWKIKGIERFIKNISNRNDIEEATEEKQQTKVTMEFAQRVNALLPIQPWKPGVDKEVISKLGCTRHEYFDAVKLLIEEGIRNKQIDGVVYDDEGNVITFDKDRVDAETLQLKK